MNNDRLKSPLLIILLFSLLVCSKSSHAYVKSQKYGVSFSSGYGVANIVPIRIGLQKHWDKVWRKDSLWSFRGYWEGSIYHLKGKRGNIANSNKSLQALALAGIVRYERNEPIAGNLWPYIDLGIGGSYLTKTEIGGRKLGIHFQFEDRAGLGVRFGKDRQYELGYRFIHFSNAFMATHNAGLNIHTIVFGYWFN